MKKIDAYKDQAIANLTGKWGSAALYTLIYLFIYQGISWGVQSFLGTESGAIFNLVWILACLPIGWSYTVSFLGLTRGEELKTSRLFEGYNDVIRIAFAYIIYASICLIGTLLFILPGIIAGLMYSQIPYILKDNKEMGVIDALRRSREMMAGHKMNLLLLILSFIGWIILVALTLGLGLLLLEPYMQTTLAHYYEDLKAENGEFQTVNKPTEDSGFDFEETSLH